VRLSRLAAALASAALLLGGCSLLGELRRPTIFILAPEDFSILEESPTEITGMAYGQIDRVTLTVDASVAGRPEGGDTPSYWRLPVTRTLGEGVHRVRAVASGPAGTGANSLVFAIGAMPFAIGFVPERLVVDRSAAGDEPETALLGLLGPSRGSGYEVRLDLEDAGGLVFDVFPFDALESTGGFFSGATEPLETGQWVYIDITVDQGTPLGEHRLAVRADGPPGTEPQRAVLTVEVVDGAAPPTAEAAAPGGPHDETYRVRSRVTESDTPGVGNRASANWRVAFGCADGRCDAEVRNGGPRGGMAPFTARYVADDETYRFEATQQIVGESCTEQRISGRIVPDTWDGQGPVRFRYRLEGVTRCGRADLRVVWEGTGRRR
jgi:hypothetical protein